jgi:hypothetical protein
MSTKQGNLLWRRMRLHITQGGDFTVDTGIRQASQNFEAGDPVLNGTLLIPSRLMVIPLVPLDLWADIIFDEPAIDPVTHTVHVTFHVNGVVREPFDINVLFWDPHSKVGPGQAQTYNALQGEGGPG